MEFTGKLSEKFRAAIKEKLTELSSYVDDELPDYIMVMVANRKNKDHMAKDLALFLGQNTTLFIDWLHAALLRLEAGSDAPSTSTKVFSSEEGNKEALSASINAPFSSVAHSIVATAQKIPTTAPTLPPPAPIEASSISLVATTPSTTPSGSTALPLSQKQPNVPNAKNNNHDSERHRRPKSPTPPTDRYASGRDRRRTPPATSAPSFRRLSSSGGKKEERERNRSGRRRRSRSRSRSRTKSRSRERHVGDDTGVSSSRSRHTIPLKSKNMLIKAMSEAERSVKVSKRDTAVAASLTSSAAAPTLSAVAETPPLVAQPSASVSRSNGGLSERIRDRLGEQRPRSRSRSPRRTRSRSVPRSTPRDRRHRQRHHRRHHHGSRSRSRTGSPGGRRRRSHSRQRRSSRVGGDASVPSSTSKPSVEKSKEEALKPTVTAPVSEETKKVMLAPDPLAAAPVAPFAVAPTSVFIPTPLPVAVSTSALVAAQTSLALPSIKESVTPSVSAEPQFVVTLTGAGDRYRQLADRLGGRLAELEECVDDELPTDYQATDLEQLAEEIIEFEEFEEEVPLPHSYKLLIGDSDTEDEQSPAKRAAAAAKASALSPAANRQPGGQTAGAPGLTNQAKQRCRYWPACKLGLTCPYWHPVEPCKTFPNCKFGSTCLFIHPPCRFQAMCANQLCPYMHSAVPGAAVPNVAPIPVATTPIVALTGAARPATQLKCRFFPNCTNMSCPFFHPTTMCRYGLACTNQQACLFNHPTLPTRNKLVWTKSASAQGPQQQSEPADTGAKAVQQSLDGLGSNAKQQPAGSSSSGSSSTVRPVMSTGKIKLR